MPPPFGLGEDPATDLGRDAVLDGGVVQGAVSSTAAATEPVEEMVNWMITLPAKFCLHQLLLVAVLDLLAVRADDALDDLLVEGARDLGVARDDRGDARGLQAGPRCARGRSRRRRRPCRRCRCRPRPGPRSVETPPPPRPVPTVPKAPSPKAVPVRSPVPSPSEVIAAIPRGLLTLPEGRGQGRTLVQDLQRACVEGDLAVLGQLDVCVVGGAFNGQLLVLLVGLLVARLALVALLLGALGLFLALVLVVLLLALEPVGGSSSFFSSGSSGLMS